MMTSPPTERAEREPWILELEAPIENRENTVNYTLKNEMSVN
jgi:hypothetical protein